MNPNTEPPESSEDRVSTWPYLVRDEFLAALVALAAILLAGLLFDAPLEEAADLSRTPLVAKAPWYFVGLQELLVYFEPSIAGVLLPAMIASGLMWIPYLDVNPRTGGYGKIDERRFAVTIFLAGLAIWIGLIVLGELFRGPSWNFFMPWEFQDANKPAVPLDHSFGLASMLMGAVEAALLISWVFRRDRTLARRLGRLRQAILFVHLLGLCSVLSRLLAHAVAAQVLG